MLKSSAQIRCYSPYSTYISTDAKWLAWRTSPNMFILEPWNMRDNVWVIVGRKLYVMTYFIAVLTTKIWCVPRWCVSSVARSIAMYTVMLLALPVGPEGFWLTLATRNEVTAFHWPPSNNFHPEFQHNTPARCALFLSCPNLSTYSISVSWIVAPALANNQSWVECCRGYVTIAPLTLAQVHETEVAA